MRFAVRLHCRFQVLLTAPQTVVAELRALGFHFGNWRDPVTGIDHGLIEIFGDSESRADERVAKLKEWFNVLQDEARQFAGVVTVWHPDADRAVLEAAGARVIEVVANDLDSALAQWRDSVAE